MPVTGGSGVGRSAPTEVPRSSAVIIRARLPTPLERLRRRSVPDAPAGVPAHLTLLYPFVEPAALDLEIRARVARIAARHRPFEYRLIGMARWPDTMYVAVDPTEPFVTLQQGLGVAFPGHPIYGRGPDFVFVPHVTVAEGAAIDDPQVATDPAWRTLPRVAHAAALEVIVEGDDGRWRTRWRFRLGAAARR